MPTSAFESLLERPRIGLRREEFDHSERMLIRRIEAGRGHAKPTGNHKPIGKLDTVWYLEGDDQAAAELFVESNREQLERIDFTRQNILSATLNRLQYGWILHYLGERELAVYPTVVVEHRPKTGETWCIDRRRYEENSAKRYRAHSDGSAKLTDISLQELYAMFDEQISEDDLRSVDGVKGNVQEILDVFRHDDRFECEPITLSDQLAVRKR